MYQTYHSCISHLFFEGFIYIQHWINHIRNHKHVNASLYIMKIKKLLDICNINSQQWQYWKRMTIISFTLLITVLFSISKYIIFCLHMLTVIITYWMTLMGNILANNFFICYCSTLYYIILNSFVLATIKEFSLH